MWIVEQYFVVNYTSTYWLKRFYHMTTLLEQVLAIDNISQVKSKRAACNGNLTKHDTYLKSQADLLINELDIYELKKC